MKNLIELMQELKMEVLKGDDQNKINTLAIEIVNRIYIPNDRQTYEDMLNQFGYQEIKSKKKGK